MMLVCLTKPMLCRIKERTKGMPYFNKYGSPQLVSFLPEVVAYSYQKGEKLVKPKFHPSTCEDCLMSGQARDQVNRRQFGKNQSCQTIHKESGRERGPTVLAHFPLRRFEVRISTHTDDTV
jgi:hypothetical protein